MLISTNQEKLSGIALGCSLEGKTNNDRVSSLNLSCYLRNPQRSANGIDLKRLNMLLAVIEKKGG